jgi:hypothetical protein
MEMRTDIQHSPFVLCVKFQTNTLKCNREMGVSTAAVISPMHAIIVDIGCHILVHSVSV